ncbi:MAG: OprO/OprP family phosphate-selective porin [bacterium]|nr:OprO/OprP family phosphate-selective porin [bacterium]
MIPLSPRRFAAYALSFALFAAPGHADDGVPQLLDVLLENGSINQEQYDALSGADATPDAADEPGESGEPLPPVSAGHGEDEDADLTARINEAVEAAIDERFGVKASYTSKGFRLETKDGNFQTNLQWRAQFRLTWPTRSDPRNVSSFGGTEELTFQARRLRMKIGGHGYRPWLKYYFEVDLEPTRTNDSGSSDTRVIDWRIDIAKYKKIALRVGQWKIDYNRERVDSSGRQQFVERSIVNRVFTIDRQVGVSLRGHLFEGTPGELRYYFGVFTGEGRGVANDDNDVMYAARLQWNFLGRDLALRQTDVERTEKPTGSLSFGFAEHTGRCTRWSSSGCGNLQAYASPAAASDGQFTVTQATQGFAFKYQGLSIQQEFHWKRVTDRSQAASSAARDTHYWGGYAQTGYFFNELFDCVPEELELAFRYAMVREPEQNATANLLKSQTRQEFTGAANWFFSGHNNKVTLDYSYLTLDNDNATTVVFGNTEDHRVRLQWDISF